MTSADISGELVIAWACFCRIGGCFMVAPGFSSGRFPMRIRLLIALALSMSCLPTVRPFLLAAASSTAPARLVQLLTTEVIWGVMIGMPCRVLVSALQFATSSISTLIGFVGVQSRSVDDGETSSALSDIFMVTFLVMFFELDQPAEILTLLVNSYEVAPPLHDFDFGNALADLAATANLSLNLAVRFSGPFIVYSIFVNMTLGMIGKIAPQIPVQFIGAPILLGGGLCLLYANSSLDIEILMSEFSSWLLSR